MPHDTNVDVTAPYGLLGRTLGHSWSPQIHQRLGSTPYALFEREPGEVGDFIRHGNWRGLNVTIPYKRDAAKLADEVSSRVRATGAANTLVRLDDRRIVAENTDVLGFAWMLSRFAFRELGASAQRAFGEGEAIVLGSGGASSAVCAALEDTFHVRPIVISRSGPITYADIGRACAGATLMVNTTPVGMYPDCPRSPVDAATLATLPHLRAVVDVVYNPQRTGICLAAERLGIPNESGLAMLVGQAGAASDLWLGRTTTADGILDEIEAKLRHSMRNVILIGMPGSGKTSAGRRLARLVGRPFIDLDDAFTVEFGIAPADCIRERGDDAFRALESKLVATYGAQSGLVIACGGGVVTRANNRDPLRQNGTIVFLDRPLDELSRDGRPLSQARGINALAAERMEAYHSWANVILRCTGSAGGDALAIADMLGFEHVGLSRRRNESTTWRQGTYGFAYHAADAGTSAPRQAPRQGATC